MEENILAKCKDCVYLFNTDRDTAITFATGYFPTVGHFL